MEIEVAVSRNEWTSFMPLTLKIIKINSLTLFQCLDMNPANIRPNPANIRPNPANIYTSTRRTFYSANKRKKNLNSSFYFLQVDVKTEDVAKEMDTEIEIQRKLVFDSYMMVKSGIKAVLRARDRTYYESVKTQDDKLFFEGVIGDKDKLKHFVNLEM